MILSAISGIVLSVLLSRVMAGRAPNWLFIIVPIPIVVCILGWRFIGDLIGPHAGTVGLLLTVLGGMSSVILPLVKGTNKEEAKSLKWLTSGLGFLTVGGSFLLAVDRSHSSEKQAMLVIESARETMDFFSGGDGYCYLAFPRDRTQKVPIKAVGKHVQHVIHLKAFPILIDLAKVEADVIASKTLTANDMLIPPYASFTLNHDFKYLDTLVICEAYIVTMTMRNCELIQPVLTCKRTDGTWSVAYAVYRAVDNHFDLTPLIRHVDQDFPITGALPAVDYPGVYKQVLEK